MKKATKRYSAKKQERAPFPSPRFLLVTVILFVVSFASYRLGLYTVNNSDLFILKQIRVEGNHYIPDSEILRMITVTPGKRMFEIELDSVVRHVRRNLYVAGVSVSRSLPSTLLITVKEREPKAYLVDKDIYMVDYQGKILLKKPTMSIKNLPLITGLSVSKLLQNRKQLIEALGLITKISEVDENIFQFVSEIYISRSEPACIYLIKGVGKV